jgi:hypothetical protein
VRLDLGNSLYTGDTIRSDCHLVTGEADVVGAAATATVGRNGSRDGGSGG